MIIDYDYFLKRIDFLIETSRQNQNKDTFLGKIKLKIPVWMQNILMPFYRMIRPYYLGIKQIRNEREMLQIPFLHPVALNFMEYFFIEHQKVSFDTSNYFEANQDNDIIDFFDNRIGCVIAGLKGKLKTNIQKEDIKNKKMIDSQVKEGKDGFYHLQIKGENEYILPVNSFSSDVFIHHYGLKNLPNEQKQYIENKDFLDIGAFCGDTCLVFLNYKPNRIYAYEPVANTYNLLLKTIQKNNLNTIIPVKKGIGEKKEKINIFSNDFDAACSSIVFNQSTSYSQQNVNEEQIEIVTIDDECKNKKIGLIKMDIEGFEYYAIKGGLNTIKRDKPILLISIYHTAKDFFEILPMIRNIAPDYKFKYVDIFPSNPIADKIVIAYI